MLTAKTVKFAHVYNDFESKTANMSFLKNPCIDGLSLKVLMVSLLVLFSWFS